MNKAIEITIPALPPASLSLNSRAHWAVKSMAKQTWQWTIYYLLYNSFGGPLDTPPFTHIKIQWEYVFRDNRKRDIDNFVGMSKSGNDVLKAWNAKGNPCGFGLIPDDSPEYLELAGPIFTIDKTRAPLTVLRIEGRE